MGIHIHIKAFDGIWNDVKKGVGGITPVMNALGMPMGQNFVTSLVTGKNPIEALKKDMGVFVRAGKFDQAVVSGNYQKAWTVATDNGKLYDKALPSPVGKHYQPDARPPTPAAIANHPAVLAAKRERILPTQIIHPVDKAAVAAHLGVPVSTINTKEQPSAEEMVKNFEKPSGSWLWPAGGLAGGAGAGFAIGGPIGAAVGGAIGGVVGLIVK